MTDKQLPPAAQAIVDAYEGTTDKYKALAAVLLALDNYYSEWLDGTYVVKSDDIYRIANQLEQF
ncbi:hypothetical protein PQC13_gp144 [Synechococcus phage S-SRM01]|uniref:Uncharacterized protein n=1 Tax=Synechococcus phage S-SRM01 TaxID=2781608 RepID=A0A879R2J2_9CAUD|nr:hypothetical protein PQC13_gp144 [Synechococcus phage S-SRM01]QPX48109.1 hypothetical protein [Synechococcus phage S-SRM01]